MDVNGDHLEQVNICEIYSLIFGWLDCEFPPSRTSQGPRAMNPVNWGQSWQFGMARPTMKRAAARWIFEIARWVRYPLVVCYITMERSTILKWDNSLFLWSSSVAMYCQLSSIIHIWFQYMMDSSMYIMEFWWCVWVDMVYISYNHNPQYTEMTWKWDHRPIHYLHPFMSAKFHKLPIDPLVNVYITM